MGFSLTDEDHMVVRHKDIKKEITTDHYLAPAISKFATMFRQEAYQGLPDAHVTVKKLPTKYKRGRARTNIGPRRGRAPTRSHSCTPKWVKVREEPEDNDLGNRSRTTAVGTQGITRTVRRKKQKWERDSIARVAFDPEPIPDCNVKANVGRDFLFHEPILGIQLKK
jgi:hypothetical protein